MTTRTQKLNMVMMSSHPQLWRVINSWQKLVPCQLVCAFLCILQLLLNSWEICLILLPGIPVLPSLPSQISRREIKHFLTWIIPYCWHTNTQREPALRRHKGVNQRSWSGYFDVRQTKHHHVSSLLLSSQWAPHHLTVVEHYVPSIYTDYMEFVCPPGIPRDCQVLTCLYCYWIIITCCRPDGRKNRGWLFSK